MISLNFTAILLAALTSFLLGWLWYSRLMFQKAWIQMANIPNVKPNRKTFAWTMSLGFLSYLVLAGTFDILFQIIGVGTLTIALELSLLFWLGFVATLSLGTITWEQKSWKLYFINAGYHLLSFLLIGTIIFWM